MIERIIGGRAHEHPALNSFYGLKAGERATPETLARFEDASPAHHVSADDPPVFLFYAEPKGPLPDDAAPGQGIHHPAFGTFLKEKLDPFKVECIVRHRDDYRGRANPQDAMFADMVDFFLRQFQAGTARKAAATGPSPSRPIHRPRTEAERRASA